MSNFLPDEKDIKEKKKQTIHHKIKNSIHKISICFFDSYIGFSNNNIYQTVNDISHFLERLFGTTFLLSYRKLTMTFDIVL